MQWFYTPLFPFFFFCSGLVSPLLAQQLEILDWQIKTEVFHPEQGTSGLMVDIRYRYQGQGIIPLPNRLQLLYNNTLVYADSTAIAVLVPNQVQQSQFFIPYRKIDLEAGDYDMIILQYQCSTLTNWSETISFRQLARLAVELEVHAASIKQHLEYWDTGKNPHHWSPDPYWTITTGAGTLPVASVESELDRYDLTAQSVRFFILENEQLFWRWYDDDGIDDDSLGIYKIPMASGDFKKTWEGQMFGDVKGLHYTYSQKMTGQQPITLRLQDNYQHQQRQGLRVEVEYHLARAYRDERVLPMLWMETMSGDTQQVAIAYPLDGASPLGEWTQLASHSGKIAYFIPFYGWNNQCKQLHFSFKTESGQRTRSAPLFLHQRLEFPNFLVQSGLQVEEHYRYKGASGLRLRLHYQVSDIDAYSALSVVFNGGKVDTNLTIYTLNGSTFQLLADQQWHLAKAQERDTLDFFIPYFSLKTQQIPVHLRMHPDVALTLYQGQARWNSIPTDLRDVALEQVSVENRCHEGNYGHVVQLRYRIPELLLPHSQLAIEVLKNGEAMENYILSATGLKDKGLFMRDTGTLYIVLPFRRLQPNDSLALRCLIEEKQSKRAISPEIRHGWQAKGELHNLRLQVDVQKLQWDELVTSAVSDSSEGAVPFVYVLYLGEEAKYRLPLSAKWDAAQRQQLRRDLVLHREDKLALRIEHASGTGERWTIWQGDWGKMLQDGFRANWSQPEELLRKFSVRFKKL